MQWKKNELSECEVVVMKCIWDEGDDLTCSRVRHRLKDVYGLDYKDTTVYTFLKNLMEKGFVTCKKNGINFYSAVRSEEDYREEMLNKVTEFWFDNSLARFASALVSSKKLTEEEKKELKGMIDELE